MKKIKRRKKLERMTSETRIELELDLDPDLDPDLDNEAERSIEVPDGFFHHMLDALTRHAGFGVVLRVEGDTHIDLHHTVEDTGIVFGDALVEALGERRGIVRFASAYAPLDEALARAVIDLSGRGHLSYRLPDGLAEAWVTRDFPLTLIEDFLQAFADRGRFSLHIDVLHGRNPHHVAEATFKALALALREATRVRGEEIPSTKGTLTK